MTGILAMQGIRVFAGACLSERRDSRLHAHGDAPGGDRPTHRAGRESRAVTQLFIEAFVLSAVAALAGVAIAALGLHQDSHGHAADRLSICHSGCRSLSPEAVLYAVVLSVFAAAIVGIVPALQATRRGLQTGLRVAGAGGMRLGKTWTILIIAQVSFAVALLPPAVSSAWEDTQDGMAGLGFAAEEFSPRSWGWTPCRAPAQRRPPARSSSPAALQAGRPS